LTLPERIFIRHHSNQESLSYPRPSVENDFPPSGAALLAAVSEVSLSRRTPDFSAGNHRLRSCGFAPKLAASEVHLWAVRQRLHQWLLIDFILPDRR